MCGFNFFLLILNFNFATMEYEVLDWPVARDLVEKNDAHCIELIDYNQGQVYQLKDSSYVVMPVMPFAKCLRVYHRQLLDEWIRNSFFPTGEHFSDFYYKHKAIMDNFPQYTDKLREELITYIQKKPGNTGHVPDSDDIDLIYKTLRKRKKFSTYRLHFYALLGSYIIKICPEEHFKWGLLQNKQMLDPPVSLVLLKKHDNAWRYFDLEDCVEGKFGYLSVQYVLSSPTRFNRRFNEIESLLRVMD